MGPCKGNKDFDAWNRRKKELELLPISKHVYPREIWWCSLGLNLGAETNGKNNNFERPVVAMKVYNKETMIILPLTTRPKSDAFHYELSMSNKKVWVKLTQSRVISGKRLSRKIYVLNKGDFLRLRHMWKSSL
jgi:mRNA interferase MazF